MGKKKINKDLKITEEKKPSIHTTISKKTYDLLVKYQKFKDKDGNFIFKRQKSKVIEKAIELLDNFYNPDKDNLQSIWNRARFELNMVLVGKRTLLSYISGDYQKALRENIAKDIIEWYKGKNIKDMSLIEILKSIKDIWLAANYFYKVDVEIGNKGSYQITFYHDFHSERYSYYWGDYFTTLLQEEKNCDIEIFGRTESLILRVSSFNQQ